MDIQELVEEIEKANGEEIDILLDTALNRRRALYPEWDMLYLAIPKNNWAERKSILENTLIIESKMRQMFEKTVDKELDAL